MLRFTKEQTAAGEHERLDPARFDFRWNADFTECEASPLLWWDDLSYARYQGDGDGEGGGYPDETPAAAEAPAAEPLPQPEDDCPF